MQNYVGRFTRNVGRMFAVPAIVGTAVFYVACGGNGDSKPIPTSTYERPAAASATPYPTNTQEPTDVPATVVPATDVPTNTPLPPGCDAYPELPSLSEAPRYIVLFSRTGGNFYTVSDFDGLGQYRFNVSYTPQQLTEVISQINTVNGLEGQYRIPEDATFSIVYDGTNTKIEYNGTELDPLPGRIDVSPLESLEVVQCGRILI